MDLLLVIIGVYGLGVVTGAVSIAFAQRLIINKCNVIVGPDADTLSRIDKRLRVFCLQVNEKPSKKQAIACKTKGSL